MEFAREGRTSFPVEGVEREFKYEVSVIDECLRIWIEDCVTRVQWGTELLTVADFTTMHSMIPQAGTVVYAQRIIECLEPSAESPETAIWLSCSSSDGSRELCVNFELQLQAFTTSLEYTFSMQEVKLNTVELVTTRINDLEAEVGELITRNKRLRADLRRMTTITQKTQYQQIQEAALTRIQHVRDWAERNEWKLHLTRIQGQIVAAALTRGGGFHIDVARARQGVQAIYVRLLTMVYSAVHFVSSLRACKEVSPLPADPSSSTTIKTASNVHEPHRLLGAAGQRTIQVLAVAGFCVLWIFASYRVIFASVPLSATTSLKDAALLKDPASDLRLRLSNGILGVSILGAEAERIERCHDVAALIHEGISGAALSKIGPSYSTVTFSINRKYPSNGISHGAYVEMLVEFDGKPPGLLARTAKVLWTKWKKALHQG